MTDTHILPKKRFSKTELIEALTNRNKYFLFFERNNLIENEHYDVFIGDEYSNCIFRDFGVLLKNAIRAIPKENSTLFIFSDNEDLKKVIPDEFKIINLFKTVNSLFAIQEEDSVLPAEYYEVNMMEARNFEPVLFELRDYKNFFEAQMLYNIKCMIKMYQILKQEFIIH